MFSSSFIRPWTTLATVAGLCCSLLFTGCTPTGNIGYVSGHVTLDGQPLPKANLEFQPDDGTPSYASTDDNGYYYLKLTGEQDGATVGTHTVRISTSWIDTDDDGKKTTRPELVPDRYHAKTELKQEVVPGSQTVNFDLKSK